MSLEPCKKEDWDEEGSEISSYYSQMRMNDMYCIPVKSEYVLSGYEGASDGYKDLFIEIRRCQGANCSSDADFDTFVNEHLDANDFFKVRLFMVDIVFRPE